MSHRLPAIDHTGRFQGLDFLRGVAAVAVVAFHFSSRLDLPKLFFHGYLGVDFFFALSGFVIAHAYGNRLESGRLGLRHFALIRLVRLLPLVVLGTAIAAVIDLLRPGQFSQATHLADIGIAFVMGCLCLPTLWTTTLEPTVFPLNSPVWSLFFELVANLCCVPLYRSGKARAAIGLAALISLGAICWAVLASGTGNLGSVPADFWLGFPRVAWSFSVGLLLSQVRVAIVPLSKWVYAALLAAILACPALPAAASAAFDLAAIVVVFPLMVLGAAQCRGANQPSRLSDWSGDMSYPLYAIHYPLVRAVGLVGRSLTETPAAHLLVAFGGIVGMVAAATWVFRLYDVPIRRHLTARLRARRTPGGVAP